MTSISWVRPIQLKLVELCQLRRHHKASLQESSIPSTLFGFFLLEWITNIFSKEQRPDKLLSWFNFIFSKKENVCNLELKTLLKGYITLTGFKLLQCYWLLREKETIFLFLFSTSSKIVFLCAGFFGSCCLQEKGSCSSHVIDGTGNSKRTWWTSCHW